MEWEAKNDVSQLQQDALAGNEYAIKALTETAPPIEYPFYWSCFNEVMTMRQGWGMSVGPVPHDKLVWYAVEWLDLTPPETRAFVEIMRALDVRSIQLNAEKNNRSK